MNRARRTCAVAFAYCLTVALTALSPRQVLAYCRTSTCLDCKRDPATGCTKGGKPVAWPNACVSFSVNSAASKTVDLAGASALMAEAFATWESARCGADGKRPSIFVSQAFGPAVCGRSEFNPSGSNANLIVFRDETWPYGGTGHELAATQLTFDDEGRIYDADIEINATGPLALPVPDAEEADGGVAPDAGAPAEYMIAYGIIPGEHDLLSIMVHEAGHFLGLDHSREENAIMSAELSPGQVRTQLTADDQAAICAAYPPAREVPLCDPTPRGGFSSTCDDGSGVFGGCSVRRPQKSSSVELLGLASLAAAFRLRRARKRGRR